MTPDPDYGDAPAAARGDAEPGARGAGERPADVVAAINARILGELERGVLPWRKPWTGVGDAARGLPRRANGAPYRGVNIVLLWLRAADSGFQSGQWFSRRQALATGGTVRRGEVGEQVVFFGRRGGARAGSGEQRRGGRNDAQGGARDGGRRDDGRDDARSGAPFLRAYEVFNGDQIDGLGVREDPGEVLDRAHALAGHEAWFASLGVTRIVHPNRAFYSPARDLIAMPPHACFASPDLYAQTLNHECVHAAGAPHRAARDFTRRYGGDAYAVEEICAELGAAYLGACLGLPPGHIHDHSAYIGSWIAMMKHDKRAFLDAASKAQLAVDWLLARSGRAGAPVQGVHAGPAP